jgi:ribosomal protein L16/L10AE
LYEAEKKLTASLTKQLEIERIKIKKYMNANGKIKGKLCPKCLQESEDSSSKKQTNI